MKKIVLLLTVLSLFSVEVLSEPTVARNISAIEIQGADGTVILKAADAWGTSCAGEYVDTVYFDKNTVVAYDAMLSMVLSAYMAQKKVRFYGGCDAAKGNTYYSGTYLIVSDQ